MKQMEASDTQKHTKTVTAVYVWKIPTCQGQEVLQIQNYP